MQFNWKFAITYSGKAIPQSKVSNSTNSKDMDTGLLSNDVGDLNKENSSGIKAC